MKFIAFLSPHFEERLATYAFTLTLPSMIGKTMGFLWEGAPDNMLFGAPSLVGGLLAAAGPVAGDHRLPIPGLLARLKN